MGGRIVALGVLVVAACGTDSGVRGDGGDGDKGTLTFGITAFNAGANAERRRLPIVADAAVAPHMIDPDTYPVKRLVAGPAEELLLTLRQISVESASGEHLLLYGEWDGSGPGVDIPLTSGPVDLAAVGLTLNAIPTGHYTRVDVGFSGSVKVRGCLTRLFAAEAAVSGTLDGQTYTTDTLTAGMHRFCTIAAKSLLNFLPAPPGTPIGSDAEYEAQATSELVEAAIAGVGDPATTTAQQVRDAPAGISFARDFDVGMDAPTKLTLVIDLNRMLRFNPNTGLLGGAPDFHVAPGLPSGTSYFFISDFQQSLAIFAGDPGSIEGYQLTGEVCQTSDCVAGSPPDALGKEWMTLIRNPDGTIAGGSIQADDMAGALWGDVVPTGVVTDATGTFTIPIGLYRVSVVTNGTLDGFRFKSVGDPEDSCTASPVQNQGPVTGHGPFPVWYTRRL